MAIFKMEFLVFFSPSNGNFLRVRCQPCQIWINLTKVIPPQKMNVVSHSVANIFKRLLVVLLLYLVGRSSLSQWWTWAGLSLATVGLIIYLYPTLRDCRAEKTVDDTETECLRDHEYCPQGNLYTTEPTHIHSEPTEIDNEPTQIENEPAEIDTEHTEIGTEPTKLSTKPTHIGTKPT